MREVRVPNGWTVGDLKAALQGIDDAVRVQFNIRSAIVHDDNVLITAHGKQVIVYFSEDK